MSDPRTTARKTDTGGRPEKAAYPGSKARGGEIILRTPARRYIFIAGLAGIVLLIVLVPLLA